MYREEMCMFFLPSGFHWRGVSLWFLRVDRPSRLVGGKGVEGEDEDDVLPCCCEYEVVSVSLLVLVGALYMLTKGEEAVLQLCLEVNNLLA